HRLAALLFSGVKPRLAEQRVIVETGNRAQERLRHSVLEHHLVDGLELEDHQSVLFERGRGIRVDRVEIRGELRELGADRRLIEVRTEAIVRVRLEQQRALARLGELAGDRGCDRAAPDAALADDEDQATVEYFQHRRY